jgi:hypothetical protein
MSIERLESATSCTAVCRHLALLDNICGLSFHHQLPNAAVLEMTASVAFPHLREADLRGCSDADEHAQPEAVRHLFQGAPRLESIRIYQWKDDYEEAFSFAPESLTRVEIGFGFDAGCLPTLAKLPHLEELILPGNVADVQFPPPTSNPFPSLLRLTVVWFSGVPDRDPERPLPQQRAKFLTALVQSMPHLRAMHLRWTVGVQKNFQAAIGEIAAWPASVVPELQHIGIPFDGTGSDLAPMYHTLLPHLPRLIAHRPVHPFCVHLCHDTPCEVDEDWRSHGHRLDDEAEEEERDEEAMEDTDFPAGGEEAMDEGDDAATVTEEQKQATESTTSHVSHPSGISFVPASSQLPLSSMLGPLRPSGTSIMLHEAAEEDADQDEDYEPAEGVSSVCEEFHLPCVRLTVTEFLDVPKTLDDDLLWQMDTAASSITQSKSELLEMIQAEQRLVDLEPYEEDANDAARTDGED